MSCSKQQVSSAVCGFIEGVTGEPVTQTEWHSLMGMAKEKGYESGRGRLDAISTYADFFKLTIENKASKELHDSALERIGFVNAAADEEFGADWSGENLENVTYTKNMSGVVKMLTDEGVEKVMAELAGRKAASGGKGSLSESARVREAFIASVLAEDKETQVRVAKSPGASASTLSALAYSPHNLVLRELAINPSLPAVAADILSGNDDVFLQQDLASNPRIPERVQLELAVSKETDVRRTLFNNKNVTAEVVAVIDAIDEESGQGYGYSHSKELEWQSGYNHWGGPILVRIVE